MSYYKKRRKRDMVAAGLVITAVLAVGVGVGIAIGWSAAKKSVDVDESLNRDEDVTISEKMFQMIDVDNIRELLRRFTSYSHLAGTPGDERLADEISSIWTGQGLHVVRRNYDVLLSYPNATDPSIVELWDTSSGTLLHRSAAMEDVLTPEQNASDMIPPYNAYSPSGDVTGDLVFANYARDEDFKVLRQNFSINFAGKIVIAKFGRIYRGDKVRLAAEAGAAAIILYMDPHDYGPPLDVNANAFPDTWWLPDSGLQRGTTMTGGAGDPLTPGYPSTDTAYRVSEQNNSVLPKIPVHPIGYKDAYYFLRSMAGPQVPRDWQGGLNFTYHIGPGHINSMWKAKLHVTVYNKRVNVSNVFGFINGSVEPDRYVFVGNHRDAWVLGGIDPTSATAVMVEMSRVAAELVRRGWKPRRSIVFCSWAAEEYGLIGSYEWVEDFVKLLTDKAVAYLNVDYVMDGNVSLTVGAMPTLHDVIIEATKKVSSPNNPSLRMYDDWLATFPGRNIRGNFSGLPRIDALGDSSDTAGFMMAAGIPCYDAWYTHNLQADGYPLYHTVYEGFILYDRILDPEYKIAKVIAQFWLETMRTLADKLVLPLNVSRYALTLRDYAVQLDDSFGAVMRDHGMSLDPLYQSIEKFVSATDDFHRRLEQADSKNPLAVRSFNDQLMMVDRAFIDPQGLPLRPQYKHVVYAPSIFNSYAGSTFPGLSDLIQQILTDQENPIPPTGLHTDVEDSWNGVKRHYAAIVQCVDTATSSLSPVTDFMTTAMN